MAEAQKNNETLKRTLSHMPTWEIKHRLVVQQVTRGFEPYIKKPYYHCHYHTYTRQTMYIVTTHNILTAFKLF